MRQPLSVALVLGLTLSGAAFAQPTTIGQPTKHQPGQIEQQNLPQTAYTIDPTTGERVYNERVAGERMDYNEYERSLYEPQRYQVDTERGLTTYEIIPLLDATSDLVPSDRAVLNDLYARQMMEAAVLDAHMRRFQESNQPWVAGAFGTLMTDHLILASRARQLYHSTDTYMPRVTTDVRLSDLTPETFPRTAADWNRTELTRLETAYANIQNPRLADLVQATRETRQQHIAMLTPTTTETTVVILVPPTTEQVAGVREVRGDNYILTHFYRMNKNEVASLRSQAESLRNQGNTAWAERFEAMARDHQALADATMKLMQEKQIAVPELPPHPNITGNPQTLIQHTHGHHQAALNELDHLMQEATDPAVRSLLQRGMEGVQAHLRMIEQNMQ